MSHLSKVSWLNGYEDNELLWEDGGAYRHWMIMYQLGYKGEMACKCGSCARAASIVDRAIEDDKLYKPKPTQWLR